MVKSKVILVIVVACLAAATMADWGKCPTSLQVKKDFNMKKFLGQWYEIARYKTLPYEKDMYCVRFKYDFVKSKSKQEMEELYKENGQLDGLPELIANEEDSKYLNFTATTFARKGSRRGDPVQVPYRGWTPDVKAEPAKLKLNITAGVEMDYWVLDTDYKDFAVIYSCKNMVWKLMHREYAWILSRKPVLDDKIKARILDALREQKIHVERFEYTIQDGCSSGADQETLNQQIYFDTANK